MQKNNTPNKDKMPSNASGKAVQKISAMAGVFARFLNLRHRHLFNKNNKLRLRYVASVILVLGLSVYALNPAQYIIKDAPLASVQMVDAIDVDSQEYEIAELELIEPEAGVAEGISSFLEGTAFEKLSFAKPEKRPDLPENKTVTIQSGDALSVVLEREGVGEDTPKTLKALSKHFDPRNIRAGQKIQLAYAPIGNGEQQFKALKIKLDPLRTVIVERGVEGFESGIDEKDVNRVVKAKRAKVKNSLYGSAAQAGIPDSVIATTMKIYSWNVDFERDIRRGDTIEVMYESFETEDGHVAKTGDILYANLIIAGKEKPLYRFKMSDGRTDYFQPNGNSRKRTLMKTPIDGARMSSGFGPRRHPVLGYNKMHKGVDFAAPTGTPIYAAGDGVIEKAGWFSSFGKYVRIRHNSELKTAYAHMSRIKVKAGSRVSQGDVIGYVGTTGRSTGAHLHYEVILKGRHVNPRSVNLPTGERLTGTNMANFKNKKASISRQFSSLVNDTKVAQNDIDILGEKLN